MKALGKQANQQPANQTPAQSTAAALQSDNRGASTSKEFQLQEDPKKGLVQCYVVFDVLFLNDQVLSAKPLHERMTLLKGLLAVIGIFSFIVQQISLDEE